MQKEPSVKTPYFRDAAADHFTVSAAGVGSILTRGYELFSFLALLSRQSVTLSPIKQ